MCGAGRAAVVDSVRHRAGACPSTCVTARTSIVIAATLVGCRGSDASVDAQVPPDPGILHVSTAGADGNDGLSAPVKTLGRAIALATRDPGITTIALAAGRYDLGNGETFPYRVPANVVITGPELGGAVLVGAAALSGFELEIGELRHLELEQFDVAVTATGFATLSDVQIRASGVAVRAETTASLTVRQLTITGVDAACATGIRLIGRARLSATELAGRALGTHVDVADASTARIERGRLVGDPACNASVVAATTSGMLALVDTTIEGGLTGVQFGDAGAPTIATITNSEISSAISAGLAGQPAVVVMTGGALTRNMFGIQANGGDWALRGVTVRDNATGLVFVWRGASFARARLRDCAVRDNRFDGIDADGFMLDLGTSTSPGNNTLRNAQGVSLSVGQLSGRTTSVSAAGNRWLESVQGADAEGRYAPALVRGPVDAGAGHNFRIAADAAIEL